MILAGCHRQFGSQIFQVFFFKTVFKQIFFPILEATIKLQTDQAVLERAGEAEITLLDIAGAGVILNNGVQLNGASPLVGHLAGNHIDHPANGIGSVKGGHGTAHHLNPLNTLQGRQPVLLETGAAVGTGFASGNPFAIHQNQGIRRRHTAHDNIRAAITGTPTGNNHPGNIAQGIGGILVVALLNLLPVNHADGSRRIFHLLSEATGSHGNLPQFMAPLFCPGHSAGCHQH